MKEEEIKAILRKENEEFAKLEEKHREYDRKIQELSAQAFLTEEEKLEEKRFKKLKLKLKDQMNDIILKYKNLKR